ncbi:MAG: DUF5916 domain-containing protein [Gemmatimonadota bacterium]|jgi:hypothetical protein
MRHALAFALFVLVVPGPTAAQELRNGPGGEPPLELPRMRGGIELDGVVGEDEWADAAELEGVMHLPDFGAEPTERTVFLLGYDDQYLYMACRAYDSDPNGVRITTLERDVSTFNTDACGIRLDTYNDEENSLLFNTTPAGVRTDWAFANDASGGPPNQDWNTFWDAAGTMTDYGWSGEIRIPLSSLGFQAVDDRVVMGFMLVRSITRKNETTVHPAVPPNWGPSSLAKPSQMQKLIMRGVSPTQPLYLTPYALGGGGYTQGLNGAGTAYEKDTDRVTEAGLDARYGITRNLNLDVSVNTDFAQVEADDQQVNLTRFSLFFPEKRRFFQERAAIFEVPLGGQERLFFSRRIGLVNREPVRIFGGARVIGRIGDWDVGFIDMQTDDHEAAPGENLGVLRVRRRIFNQYSYLGGMVTSRLGNDGSYNVVYASDASTRLFGQDYLLLTWAQSFDDTDTSATDAFDRSLVRVQWQRRGTDGISYNGGLVRAGEVFEPGMGFLRRRGYISTGGNVSYGWRPGVGSALNSYSLNLISTVTTHDANFDAAESGQLQLRGQLETRAGHSFSVGAGASYEDLQAPFNLSPDAGVPVGDYWFFDGSLNYNAPNGALFRPQLRATVGQFYDGSRVTASVSPSWSVSQHLRLSGTYELNHIDFGERDQQFTAHIGRLRTEFTFTTATSASAFVQYNSAADEIVWNARFRWNPREGTDLYLVWNETLNSERDILDPRPPLSQARTLLVKYSRTFTLGL